MKKTFAMPLTNRKINLILTWLVYNFFFVKVNGIHGQTSTFAITYTKPHLMKIVHTKQVTGELLPSRIDVTPWQLIF